MIGISALAALISTVAVLVLDRLIVNTYPLYPIPLVSPIRYSAIYAVPLQREQERDVVKGRKTVAALAILKLALALALVGLSAFLEYEHEMVSRGEERAF